MPADPQIRNFRQRLHPGGSDLSDFELGLAYQSRKSLARLTGRVNALSAIAGLPALPVPTLQDVINDVRSFAADPTQDP